MPAPGVERGGAVGAALSGGHGADAVDVAHDRGGVGGIAADLELACVPRRPELDRAELERLLHVGIHDVGEERGSARPCLAVERRPSEEVQRVGCVDRVGIEPRVATVDRLQLAHDLVRGVRRTVSPWGSRRTLRTLRQQQARLPHVRPAERVVGDVGARDRGRPDVAPRTSSSLSSAERTEPSMISRAPTLSLASAQAVPPSAMNSATVAITFA